jgi:hypothetical protein
MTRMLPLLVRAVERLEVIPSGTPWHPALGILPLGRAALRRWPNTVPEAKATAPPYCAGSAGPFGSAEGRI